MQRFLARRLLLLVPTALAIVLVCFALIHLAPGDPVLAMAGEHGDAGYYSFMRERFGLDRPLPEQFVTFGARLLTGDVGTSYTSGRPAMAVVLERVPATLLLTLTALIVSTGLGLLLGILAGTRVGRPVDLAVSTATLGLYAAPVFWLGQLAVLGLGYQMGLFPIQGFRSPGSDSSGLLGALDIAWHLALPALVLAAQEVAAVARLTRSALAEELRKDYVRTARAKGLTEFVVIARHAMRRVWLPVVTLLGGRMGYLLGGAVVVEIVFAWPGIGRLLVAATQTRDTPVLLAVFLLISATVMVANLITDLVYAALDPRIRYR